MWLESLVLKSAEKRLLPYRTEAKKLKSTREDYKEFVPRLQVVYAAATHWHGTGRYHYVHGDTTRYEHVDSAKCTDILASIIENNGLRPHLDPWIDSGGKTVSLATVRMHARLFARIHLEEGKKLFYEMGNVQYWLRLYLRLLALWLLTHSRLLLWFIKVLSTKSLSRGFQIWVGAIRQQEKPVGIWSVLKGEVPGSDISGNYPLLFGVAGKELELLGTIPLVHAVEARSLNRVQLENITHVEVPLAHMKETQDFLERKGIKLPVLPLEYADLYMSETPVRKLAYT